jgi:hypothetical protein
MHQDAIQTYEYKTDMKYQETSCNRTDICRSNSAIELDNKPGKQ